MTTEDIVAVAVEIAGRDLDGLFDSWLFGETSPPSMGMYSGLGSQTAPAHAQSRATGEGCRIANIGDRPRRTHYIFTTPNVSYGRPDGGRR